ncbi:hypothetical protein LINPERPRIM_LOCUS5930 [Linum perenne]
MGSCWIGNNRNSRWLLMIGAGVVVATLCSSPAYGCSDGQCKEGEACSSDKDCGGGLYCFSCFVKLSSGSRCVRSTATNQFQILVSTSESRGTNPSDWEDVGIESEKKRQQPQSKSLGSELNQIVIEASAEENR